MWGGKEHFLSSPEFSKGENKYDVVGVYDTGPIVEIQIKSSIELSHFLPATAPFSICRDWG